MNNVKSPSESPCTCKKLFWLAALAILSTPFAVYSESQPDSTDGTGKASVPLLADMRIFVEIPENARKILQGDMLDHLAVLSEINRHLAEKDLDSAAEIAETGMGRNLKNKYQDVEMRPGRYMPQEMREIGWELHNAATRFAKVARQGDLQKTLLAYQRITGACVACHYSYRTY